MKIIRDDPALVYGGSRRPEMSMAEAMFLAKLGHDLRSMYTVVLDQPLPDQLAFLADRIARREQAESLPSS